MQMGHPHTGDFNAILPIQCKIRFLCNIEILRALRFKRSYAFLKRPPDVVKMAASDVASNQNYVNIETEMPYQNDNGTVRYEKEVHKESFKGIWSYNKFHHTIRRKKILVYGSGHETVAALLPGFAINWLQNQVTRQPQFRELTHICIDFQCAMTFITWFYGDSWWKNFTLIQRSYYNLKFVFVLYCCN